MLVPSKGNLRVTARSLVPLMDVSDRVTRLECSAPRERRYATKARSPVSRSLPLRPGGVYAKPLVPDHRPRLGGPPFFARGFIPSSAWSVSGSRRTSSVGRGCEALPLWPRWERRGDSSTLKMRSPAGFTPRRWSRVFLLKQVVVGLVPSSAVYLVDPASSHMLVSKIKPCKCQHMPPNG